MTKKLNVYLGKITFMFLNIQFYNIKIHLINLTIYKKGKMNICKKNI